MTQCMVSNQLTAEQRAATRPWAIAFVAALIVEFVSLAGGILYMVLVPEFTQIVASGILTVVCVKRVVFGVCSRRMQRISGEQPTSGPGFWLGLVFATLSFGYFVVSILSYSNSTN